MLEFLGVCADYPRAGTEGRRCSGRGAWEILLGPVGRGSTDPAEERHPHRRSGRLRVLLANEPRSYRESIAAVFRQLRPELDVEVAEPEDLESSVSRSPPDVAICSRVTGEVQDLVPVWVELYPGHSARSVAFERGERTEYAEIQLGDLLSVLDRAAGTA